MNDNVLRFQPIAFHRVAEFAERALRRALKAIYPNDGLLRLMVTSCSVCEDEGKQMLTVYFDIEGGEGGVWHFNVETLCDEFLNTENEQ